MAAETLYKQQAPGVDRRAAGRRPGGTDPGRSREEPQGRGSSRPSGDVIDAEVVDEGKQ